VLLHLREVEEPSWCEVSSLWRVLKYLDGPDGKPIADYGGDYLSG